MPGAHCTILALIFTCWQFCGNRKCSKSEPIRSSFMWVTLQYTSVLCMIKDAIWLKCQCVADAHEMISMLNIWPCLSYIMQCKMCFDWKLLCQQPTANENARYRARERGEGVIDLQQNTSKHGFSKQSFSPSYYLF